MSSVTARDFCSAEILENQSGWGDLTTPAFNRRSNTRDHNKIAGFVARPPAGRQRGVTQNDVTLAMGGKRVSRFPLQLGAFAWGSARRSGLHPRDQDCVERAAGPLSLDGALDGIQL